MKFLFFEGAAYRKTCFRFFKLMCATVLGKICASNHAMNAVDEMRALNTDVKKLWIKTVRNTRYGGSFKTSAESI